MPSQTNLVDETKTCKMKITMLLLLLRASQPEKARQTHDGYGRVTMVKKQEWLKLTHVQQEQHMHHQHHLFHSNVVIQGIYLQHST